MAERNVKEYIFARVLLVIFISFILLFALWCWNGYRIQELEKEFDSEQEIIMKERIICYAIEHRIHDVWDFRNNIIYNETYDTGYSWKRVTCPDDVLGEQNE